MSTLEKDINRMLTVNDVAYLLKVHPGTIRRWEKSGQLKSLRFGAKGLIRFHKEDLFNFLDQTYAQNVEDRQFFQLLGK